METTETTTAKPWETREQLRTVRKLAGRVGDKTCVLLDSLADSELIDMAAALEDPRFLARVVVGNDEPLYRYLAAMARELLIGRAAGWKEACDGLN